jgi:basic amino acid/polyamine antiporter, APA family
MPNTKPNTLGLCMLTALVTGNMIGSGVFLLPAALASYGSIGIVSWIFTSFGALSLALVFGKLSTVIQKTGGPYAYCHEAFGDFIGFLIAYSYWIALCVGNAAIVVAFVGYLTVFFPILGKHPMLVFLACAITVWTLTLVNIFGIKHAGRLQLITTILKLIPLILIATVGLFYMHPAYLSNFNVSGKGNFSAFTSAATLTLWSFIGVESATVPAENARNPGRDILLATIFGTLLASVVYIFSTLAIMGIMPTHQLVHSAAPYADAAKIIFGPWGAAMIALGALISCFGTLNGWTLLQGQIPFAAARDHLFPRVFAKQSRFGTPIFALATSSLLITILLLLTLNASLVKQFTFIILLATLSSLIPYFFTVMSELVLLVTRRDAFHFKWPILSIFLSIVAGIYAFWMIMGAGEQVVFYGMLLFLSGMPVYAWMKWWGTKES